MSLRKILIYSGSAILLVLILAVGSTFLLKDKIVSRFIEEANKHIATPIKIGKMDITVFSHFPNMSIEFRDVYVEDSYPEIFPLFTAKRISFSFNAYDAWQGKYDIKSLNIIESETNIRINKKGVGNFQVTKDSVGDGGNLSLDLNNVRLKKTRFSYNNEQIGQSHELNSSSLEADVELKNNVYDIAASGDMISNQIGIGSQVFLKDKLFNIELQMVYNDAKKEIVINQSSIEQEHSSFELNGRFTFLDQSEIDLALKGKNTSLQTILSFFPLSLSSPIRKYESKGNLYFQMDIAGRISKPVVKINFGCKDASIFHPETNFKITGANLAGTFTSNGFSHFSSAAISLSNVSGKLNGKDFTGNFFLKNFNEPFVDFKFKGELDAATVNELMGKDFLKDASGILIADVSLLGEPKLLKDKKTAQQVNVGGTIELKDVSLSSSFKEIKLKGLNGSFSFSNNDLAMSNVTGKLGKSDFTLNGFFKNIVPFLLFPDQPIGIETDLRSNNIDLEELFQLGFGQEANSEYQFKISPSIHLKFDCEIDRLSYRKFVGHNVSGDLLVKNQNAISKQIKLKTMGGSILLNGLLEAASNNPIELNASAKLSSIHIDSLFYIFGNFDQDFITDKHLKGKATADISFQTQFTPELNIKSETLVSTIDMTIKQGQLNNFEPLQSLKKYLDDDGLKNLRFADLKNEILIENKMVMIPNMEVRSNVTTIQVSGKHWFDQKIDYRIVAPLLNKKKINIEEAGEALEDQGGKLKVHFKITGTTDNYKVAYDTEAMKKKIAKDLKREFTELKDAFKDKGLKKKTEVELAKDDYFDW